MMVRFTFAALLALCGPALATTQAEINATLSNDPGIWGGLRAVAVADTIRTNCSAIEARDWRARMFILGLYNDARAYGYSRDQIRAFQRDEGMRDRMRAEVMAYLDQRGVREGASETYCALGQAEIASGSQAGELLRAR